MLLGEMLHAGVVTVSLRARDKETAILELIDLAISAGGLPVFLRDHAREIIRARETTGSTGMEHGIALPHATSERTKNVVAALGVARHGIDWDCLDYKPARLIILLIMPRRQFQVHVRTLAGISHLLNNDAFCDSLINARDAKTLLNRVQREEEDSVFDAYRTP